MSAPGSPKPLPNNFFLTGFMGSGKSSVGRHLARMLRWEWIDLDREIERREGCPIPEIFRNLGEAGFRQLETQALEEKCRQKDRVISLGGGALLLEQNRSRILASGWLVFLSARPETLAKRLTRGVAQRPLLQGKTGEALLERVRELLLDREALYAVAQQKVETDSFGPDRVAKEILKQGGFKP